MYQICLINLKGEHDCVQKKPAGEVEEGSVQHLKARQRHASDKGGSKGLEGN